MKMLKSIQAYFPSEDKAEAAKTLMVRYKTELVEVSKLANTDEEREAPVAVPFAGALTGIPATGMGVNGGFIVERSGDESSDSHMSYVLSTKVEEEDYNAIVDIINNNYGEM